MTCLILASECMHMRLIEYALSRISFTLLHGSVLSAGLHFDVKAISSSQSTPNQNQHLLQALDSEARSSSS